MKKATISIQLEQEKLRAIQFYAGKKESTLESELEEFTEKLYEKYVPTQTREYIESLAAEEPRSRPRPSSERRERSVSSEPNRQPLDGPAL